MDEKFSDYRLSSDIEQQPNEKSVDLLSSTDIGDESRLRTTSSASRKSVRASKFAVRTILLFTVAMSAVGILLIVVSLNMAKLIDVAVHEQLNALLQGQTGNSTNFTSPIDQTTS